MCILTNISSVSCAKHWSSGAFLMRPVGGVMIGYLGDKYGRKYGLVTSLFLM